MNDEPAQQAAPEQTTIQGQTTTTTTQQTETTSTSPQPEKHTSLIQWSNVNKKSIYLIIALFAIGVVVGLVLSNFFINETNELITQINEQPAFPGGFPYYIQPLTADQALLPSFGVIIVCISVLLLIGVIAVYTKIVLKTKSRYIIGLLIFLVPLLAETIVSISALRTLFISAAIPYLRIRDAIGFNVGGFGSVLVVVSVFEIIGLTMLLYLSQE